MHKIKKPTHASLDWLMKRHRDAEGRVIFGGSEAGALMGVSEYTTLADLCIAKLGEPVEREPEPQMMKGIYFEDGLLQFASKQLGMIVKTPDEMYGDRRFIATLDGIAYDHGQPFAVVECKVTSAYTVNTADDLPASWIMQGHVQYWVTDLPVYFAVFDKRQHMNLIEMPFDLQLAQDIFDTADNIGAMLDDGMLPDEAAATLTAEQIQMLYPVKEQRAIVATDELVNYIFDLETTRRDLKKLKDEESALMDLIARAMQDAELITDGNGHSLLSWKQQAGRASFDSKAFQQAHPDLYQQFIKQGSPFRVMRIGKAK